MRNHEAATGAMAIHVIHMVVSRYAMEIMLGYISKCSACKFII